MDVQFSQPSSGFSIELVTEESLLHQGHKVYDSVYATHGDCVVFLHVDFLLGEASS